LLQVRKDSVEAERYFKRAIEIEPRDANALGNYAIVLKEHRKDLDAADDYFQRALRADPNHVNNLVNYANFLGRLRGDTASAQSCFKRALEHEPWDPRALLGFGVLMKQLGDFDAAESILKRAVEAHPDDTAILETYATFLAGTRGVFDQAESYYERALKADPESIITLANYAQMLLAVGRTEKGRAVLERARELIAPTSPPDVQIEVNLYYLAHFPELAESALGELRRLVRSGARSIGWDFTPTLTRAPLDGCQHVPLLGALVDVVSKGADPSILNAHSDWVR
jgi:Tfp pilus assembly protein PilF